MDGRTSSTSAGACSPSCAPICATSVPMPAAMASTRGRTLSAAVPRLWVKLSSSPPRSASSRAMPVSRFCHAAFMELALPSMVLAASLAVVPVMPMLSCTAWMAWMIWSKLTPSRFSMVRLSTPLSLISRTISSCVPP